MTGDAPPKPPRPLAALAEICATLSSTLHAPALVQAVVGHVGKLLPCEGAFLCEFDEATDALIFRSSHGLPDEVAHTMQSAPPLPRGRGTFSQLAQSSMPLVISDLAAEGVMRSPFLPWFVQAGYRAMLGVPLMREGRTMGGLVIFRRAVGGFSADEVDLLSAFAAECALALAHARLFQLLEERGRILTASLAQQDAANEVLRVMAQSRADSQPVFDTIARSAAKLCQGEMAAVFGVEGGLIHILAHHNWSDVGLSAFKAMYPRRPSEPSIVAICVAERRVVHVPDTEAESKPSDDDRPAGDARVPQASLSLTRLLRYRAVVAVPMLRDGQPIGAIGVMRSMPGAFSDGQIALLRTFADQAVVAVETSRLFAEVQERNDEIARHRDRMESELQLAREIQLDMMPSEFAAPSAARPVAMHATLVPAREIGGDMYDFFWLRDGRLCFVVADVSDKGAPAALYMARTKTLVRAMALLNRRPDSTGATPSLARVVALVNEELCVDNRHAMFVTLFVGMLDPRNGEVEICNAGHPEPLVLRAGAAATTVWPLSGPRCTPLGVSPRTRYSSAVHALADGDILFAFTDGITEAADAEGRLFGEERLAAALLQAHAAMRTEAGAEVPVRQLVDEVIAAVRRFAGDAPQADDIAALALRPLARQPGTAQARADVRLEIAARIESMAEVSAAVDELAARHALPTACRNNMQIVLDEVLSNIVHHAPAHTPAHTGGTVAPGTPDAGASGEAATIHVCLAVGGETFDAEIEDDGPPFDPTRPLPPLATGGLAERPVGGLGLHLVQQLCASLDYRRVGGTNRLRLRVSLAAPP